MWIRVVTENQAEGEIRRIYENIRKARGKIANILLVQGLNPRALHAHLELYLTIMFGRTGLSRAQREMIAVVVSARNGCDYCLVHHSQALSRLTKGLSSTESLTKDLNAVGLNEKDRRMLEYAIKLTEDPINMLESDVTRLKNVGFSDSEILDIVLVVGYFNLVNRIASGLGVEYNQDEAKGYNYQA